MRLLSKSLYQIGLLYFVLCSYALAEEHRWSAEQANKWYAEQPWPTGFNYAPRYAINQLEMWQKETFDPEVIDQELGWASEIGFNMARVFLHDLLWEQDRKGFLKRVDQFLAIADKHNIKVMLVLFDDVWDPFPKLGKQRSPIPHTHNSGWVQGPGKAILGDYDRHDELQSYVQGIVSRYGQDERVAIWDLYNEPGNTNPNSYDIVELGNKHRYSLQLIKKVFRWAREVQPSQPITSSIWRSNDGKWVGEDPQSPYRGLYRFMLDHSDILTFHVYSDLQATQSLVSALQQHGRPLLCTEYMARETGSTFENIMPYFADNKVGAIHWGFVSGKSQTIYPWRSWPEAFSGEADPWFHDLLRADGTPYSDKEVALIKALIIKSKQE
ncbi:cellulase family glycosylhydrolase [Porticoccus sp. W117]|uniref:cellulase family glycosylhydrolase n=1 Tax=Porticoccus sp. W117 TaxID=3054777 RepID=UPI00259659A5|nr:cellulase family glycosylhydrolase [Porticoccus sp. W117]MDM3870068.1 cellulase family glycosylhydrolase [Porticoccus sp. W117]